MYRKIVADSPLVLPFLRLISNTKALMAERLEHFYDVSITLVLWLRACLLTATAKILYGGYVILNSDSDEEPPINLEDMEMDEGNTGFWKENI